MLVVWITQVLKAQDMFLRIASDVFTGVIERRNYLLDKCVWSFAWKEIPVEDYI